MTTVVREATLGDEEEILELYRATPELHKNAVVDLLDEGERKLAWSDPRKILLVAVDESTESIRGFLYVKIKDRTITEEKARILHVAVRQEDRKFGIGTQLLQECVLRLLKRGDVHTIYSCVNVQNRGMINFLAKHGFKMRELYFRFEADVKKPSDFQPFPLDWWTDFGTDE
ncbi:MAG: GNAT family N-acetyltransferase [bacterium]|nr:GNAT family N-acetyltransferase [bacterium]